LNIDEPPEMFHHAPSSFYNNTKFSPCGKYIVSGSSDTNMYLYKTEGSCSFEDATESFIKDYSKHMRPLESPYLKKALGVLKDGHN